LLQPPPSPSLSATSSISSWLRKSPNEQPQEDVTFMPSHTTREAMIEMLEKKNTELSTQLEQTVQTQEKQGRMHKKKERELETEIKFLKGSLDHATVKIQEMEEKQCPKIEEDVSLLHEKIKHLRLENDQQVDQFQFTLHDHEQLQKSKLEEHRTLLGQLKEQGVIYYEEEEYEEEESNQNLLRHEDNTNLLESILVQAGVVEKDALDDALSLIGQNGHWYDDNFSMVSTQQKAAIRMVKQMLYFTWRWFRFTLIMTIAVFLSLKEGPPPPPRKSGLITSTASHTKQ
ncbi:uncharacterized protein B0P05DRAFT_544095, partial [Gilbertella persicaria]|uniref:uncharacterized protein n=1 Tax=Gilbertella persicaria TaxID=101096 RepID=UPI00221F7AC0